MLCQNCEKNEATTHIKQIINGKMTQTHLCSDCAKHLGYGDMFSDFSLNLSEFFGNFFGDTLPSAGQSVAGRCPKCSFTFNDIVREGKVGCAQCYETFYDKLLPSLQRIHGKIRHSGKVSRGITKIESAPEAVEEQPVKETVKTVSEKIEELQAQMQQAVAEQNFELAAKIRDEIKAMEGGEN